MAGESVLSATVTTQVPRTNLVGWQHVPTQTTVAVDAASITLPLLTDARTTLIEGTSTPRLEGHLAGGLEIAQVDATPVAFDLGPPLR